MPRKAPTFDYFRQTGVHDTEKPKRTHWFYQNWVEWPPDDGRWIGFFNRFRTTHVCLECGFSGRFGTYEEANCIKGHGKLHNIGTKLRLPRKAKLQRWLKKLREGKVSL